MPQQNDRRVNFLQALNTIILTVISIVTICIFITLNNVKNLQQSQSEKIIVLKTVQDINIQNVSSLEKRVSTLEVNYMEYIKNWVDQNYVRKSQSKEP